ncbi:D-alanyl-D-alanine endopeptidase [Bordetella tumulicola]|uniref:D-alanyl-D-alanine endopeptidase n=1 Tax=Bordetella tumulicola TaxID=1649133 RepID=UPI0039EF8F74
MVSFWKRAVAITLVPMAVALIGLLPGTSYAAKADPCKTNAKSSACKAVKSKTAGKTSTAKASTKTSSSAKSTSKKTSATKQTARTSTKSAAKKSTQKTSKSRSASRKKSKIISRQRTAPAAVASAAALPAAEASIRDEIRALRSSTAYAQDLETSTVLFAKNEDVVRPIASISKLMTALVVVDANQPMDQMLEITEDDVDKLKHTTSRLRVGTQLTRGDMLHLALMSSENRAAHALGRNYPGGILAFVRAMNEKARGLGMTSTYFIEPTGLSSQNVSSPRDLARLLRAAAQRPLIHRYSTDDEYEVDVANRTQVFRNTNLLVRKPDWDIKVSKTGFINEAGECLVMMTRINGRDVAIVLLDSQGKYSRIGDAVRLRRILQNDVAMIERMAQL